MAMLFFRLHPLPWIYRIKTAPRLDAVLIKKVNKLFVEPI
jgi:hypothetical protein